VLDGALSSGDVTQAAAADSLQALYVTAAAASAMSFLSRA
jgi:hypothetical protein